LKSTAAKPIASRLCPSISPTDLDLASLHVQPHDLSGYDLLAGTEEEEEKEGSDE
jgi:hypothetical protein